MGVFTRAQLLPKAPVTQIRVSAPAPYKNPTVWENESIYIQRSGALLKNGLDRPEHRYGRYGFASLPSISTSTLGVDGTRDSL